MIFRIGVQQGNHEAATLTAGEAHNESEFSMDVNTTLQSNSILQNNSHNNDVSNSLLTEPEWQSFNPYDDENPDADADVTQNTVGAVPFRTSDVSSIEVARDASFVSDRANDDVLMNPIEYHPNAENDDDLYEAPVEGNLTADDNVINTSLPHHSKRLLIDDVSTHIDDADVVKSTKRRKIRIDNHNTTLSSQVLKDSILDWSDTMRHRSHVADVTSKPNGLYDDVRIVGVQDVMELVRLKQYARRDVRVQDDVSVVREDVRNADVMEDEELPLDDVNMESNNHINESEEEVPDFHHDVLGDNVDFTYDNTILDLEDLSLPENIDVSTNSTHHPHTHKVYQLLQQALSSGTDTGDETTVNDAQVTLSEMLQQSSRHTAAAVFMEVLVLKSLDCIDVLQKAATSPQTSNMNSFVNEDKDHPTNHNYGSVQIRMGPVSLEACSSQTA